MRVVVGNRMQGWRSENGEKKWLKCLNYPLTGDVRMELRRERQRKDGWCSDGLQNQQTLCTNGMRVQSHGTFESMEGGVRL